MVTSFIVSPVLDIGLPTVLAAADKVAQLPETTRAAALMALVGIALVGLLFIAAILLGGHWVRRQGSYRRGAPVPPDAAPLDVTEAKLAFPDTIDPNASRETLCDGGDKSSATLAD